MFPWTDPSHPLRFDRFMKAALHNPGQGYYARRIRGVGQRGDFTTTPALSPALGRAVSHWADRALENENCRDLIELGPGEGSLAEAVLRHLPWRRRLRLRLHLVESSAPLRAKQAQALGGRVQSHGSVEEALESCDGNACLYSNEFVDAFPVRRFRKSDEFWNELHLLPDRELWIRADDLPDSTLFEQPWGKDQVIEVHQSYHQWLRALLPHWKRGRMLTIDYGSLDSDLYHRQPEGSFRAYFHHQHLTGPEAWARPGHQDLTADVNFSDLSSWAKAGTEQISLISQSEFLTPHIDPSHPADRYAVDPAGPGSAFLCLDQRRKP